MIILNIEKTIDELHFNICKEIRVEFENEQRPPTPTE
jgi:hypothetical protein